MKAGKATINGVSIADKAKAMEWAKAIVEVRADARRTLIQKAIANKGTTAVAKQIADCGRQVYGPGFGSVAKGNAAWSGQCSYQLGDRQRSLTFALRH